MKPSAWTGALIGAAAMATLVAVDFFGWQLFGLSFAPYDLFDTLTRALPGAVATAGVDVMIAAVRAANVASTSTAAKTLEQMAAVALTIAAGGIAGWATFAALRLSGEPASLLGLVLGAAWGTGAIVAADRLDRLAPAPGPPVIAGLWLLAGFSLWGFVVGWSHDRLRRLGEAASTGDAPAAAGRRRFLLDLGGGLAGVGALTAISGAIAAALRASVDTARWSDSHDLPNAGAQVTPVPGTRSEFTALADHYRVDIDTEPPRVDAGWRLAIGGLVRGPLTLSLDDLREYEPIDQFVTLCCVSNPVGGDLIGTTRWTGVALRDLLARAGVLPRATHLEVVSADGFSEVVAIDAVRADGRIMLAYAWDGVPLPRPHGFPLRLYVPDRYGMKQPKWIASIEAIDRWKPGYWVARGLDREGFVESTAVLDAARVVRSSDGTGSIISVGGIAYAGARGVSRVEVRVGEGEWQVARLRDPISETTWVVWRADITLRATSTVMVRCYDGKGRPQTSPWHTTRLRLNGRVDRLAPSPSPVTSR